MKKIVVSIIIPVYNEEKYIGKCIQSLLKQSYKDFEIIIVDDGSVDNTIRVVKKFTEVKIIKGEHKGPGFSRNLGSKKAKGKILVFVDADMTFDKDYLKNLVNPLLKDKKVIGSTHELEIVNNLNNIWSKCWGRIRVSKEQAKDVKIFRAIRKEIFIERGGFDPKYGYADDQTLWIKHKIKPVVAKNTICYHENPKTLREVYRQSIWIGASLDNKLLNFTLLKYLNPLILILISPIAIGFLSVKKSHKQNALNIFLQMFIFMTVRYFGTISGIFKRIYLKKNVR